MEYTHPAPAVSMGAGAGHLLTAPQPSASGVGQSQRHAVEHGHAHGQPSHEHTTLDSDGTVGAQPDFTDAVLHHFNPSFPAPPASLALYTSGTSNGHRSTTPAANLVPNPNPGTVSVPPDANALLPTHNEASVSPPPLISAASGTGTNSTAPVPNELDLVRSADEATRHLGPGRACNRCRQRKLRCSAERPMCQACERVKLTAERRAAKAGRPPPSAADFVGLCVYGEPTRKPRTSQRTPTPAPYYAPYSPATSTFGSPPPGAVGPASDTSSVPGPPPAKRARTMSLAPQQANSLATCTNKQFNNPLDSLAAAAAATRAGPPAGTTPSSASGPTPGPTVVAAPLAPAPPAPPPPTTTTKTTTTTTEPIRPASVAPDEISPDTQQVSVCTGTSLNARLTQCLPPSAILIQHVETFARDCPWLCCWDTTELCDRIGGTPRQTLQLDAIESSLAKPHPSLLLAILAWVHTLHPDLAQGGVTLPVAGQAILQAQTILGTQLVRPDAGAASAGGEYASLALAGIGNIPTAAPGVEPELAPPTAPQEPEQDLRTTLDLLQARVVLDQYTFSQAFLSYTWFQSVVTSRWASTLRGRFSSSCPPNLHPSESSSQETVMGTARTLSSQSTAVSPGDSNVLETIDMALLSAGWLDQPDGLHEHPLANEVHATARMAHAFCTAFGAGSATTQPTTLPLDLLDAEEPQGNLKDLYVYSLLLVARVPAPKNFLSPAPKPTNGSNTSPSSHASQDQLIQQLNTLDQHLTSVGTQKQEQAPLVRTIQLAILAARTLLYTPRRAKDPEGAASQTDRSDLVHAARAMDRAVELIQSGASEAVSHPPLAAWSVAQIAAALIRLAAQSGTLGQDASEQQDRELPQQPWGPVLHSVLTPTKDPGAVQASQRTLQDTFQLCWLFLDQVGTRLALGNAAKQALYRVLEQMK